MTLTVAYLLARQPLLGGEWYRATRPAALANRKFGWGTAACTKMATREDNPGGPLSFVTPDDMVVTPDLIVIRPIAEWRQHWTDQAHANGQLVIADIDDDVWVHEDRYGNSSVPEHESDHYDEWFWNVDAVLTSTPYLAKRIRAMGHKAKVIVAPNCYSPFELDASPVPARVIGTRLWLSGRMDGDLVLYDELVRPLLEELDLVFLHVGAEDGHRFTDRGWDPNRLEQRAAVPIPMLAQALAGLAIGSICMSDHPYNTAKTETHAVELASMGVPLVAASRHSLYIGRVPGCVEPTPQAVRERVRNLLNPVYWRSESAIAKTWARRVALTNETQHLNALTRLVAVLYSERTSDTDVITKVFST